MVISGQHDYYQDNVYRGKLYLKIPNIETPHVLAVDVYMFLSSFQNHKIYYIFPKNSSRHSLLK